MTILRRLSVLAATATVGSLLVAMSQSPATSRTAHERCSDRGPIPASGLTRGSERLGCSLVGRVVYAGSVRLVVPPAGVSVSGDGVGQHGDVVGLTVTNTGTRVIATRDAGAAARDTAARTAATSSPPACKDRTFHLEHHHWATSLRWHDNLTHAPKRYHNSTLIKQIRRANKNMRTGHNNCGKPRLKTPIAHFLGKTKVHPNVVTHPKKGTVGCGHYNTKNVVGFGNLPGYLLGWTCYWWTGHGHISATDIMLDTGKAMTTHLPKNCTNRWDFQGVITHEWGHAYGMAHARPGHANLTMEHEMTPCSTYARTLGLGDWLGMKKMYGAK